MDKKTVALAVALIILAFAWPFLVNRIWPPPPPPPRAAEPAPETAKPPPTEPTAETTPAEQPPAPLPARRPDAPRPPEQVASLENDFIRVEFTSHGGGIKQVILKKYREKNGDSENVLLNRFGTAPLGQVQGPDGFDETTAYEMRQAGAAVTFEASNEAGIRLTKEYRLGSDYRLELHCTLTNHGNKPLKQARLTVALGSAVPRVPTDTFDTANCGWDNGKSAEWVNASHFDASWFTRRPARTVIRYEEVPVAWVGLDDRFFCLLWMPQTPTNTVHITRRFVQHPGLPADPSKPRPANYALDAALQTAAVTLDAGQSHRYSFQLYAGPKEYHRLQALGQRQTEIMHWGWFEWMAELLLKSMNGLHKLVPNYFFIIILITIVIKLLFWPLTAISNRNMKAMQALSPKLTALREKYKDDPQKLNAEMMKLYKENKVNPMAGCLPTLVQIPVFIGFYYMLRSAIELRGHGFLWIADLSQPDTVLHLFGFPLNPLPLAMGGTMIWQMKMTPTGGDPMQQKIMMFMPLLFLFFCYGMPSGLVLYWTVQNIFTIVQMRLTRSATVPAQTPAAPAPAAAKTKPRTKLKTK